MRSIAPHCVIPSRRRVLIYIICPSYSLALPLFFQHPSIHGRRLFAEFGGRETNSRIKFSNYLFKKKCPFSRRKFLMTFFMDRIVSVFRLSLFTINLILCNLYDPFLAEKPLFLNKTFLHDNFFSRLVLCHASNNTTSQNIGGTNAWAVPHLKFGGTVPALPL